MKYFWARKKNMTELSLKESVLPKSKVKIYEASLNLTLTVRPHYLHGTNKRGFDDNVMAI
jgi:hypothetical protein